MSKPADVYKFGHLHMALFHSGKPGAAWAVYANYDEKGLTRNAPVFSGVIEPKTGAQLRKIADAIDAIMREEQSPSYRPPVVETYRSRYFGKVDR